MTETLCRWLEIDILVYVVGIMNNIEISKLNKTKGKIAWHRYIGVE